MNEEYLFATEDQMADLVESQTDEIEDTRKYLIFVTDDLKFGIDTDYVVEIITNHVITPLPMLPAFVRGIINLRGQMTPILDVRMRLGKPEADNFLVIVLDINGTQLGILVDAVDQMIDIPTENILPMAANSVQQLVSGMCSLPDSSGTMLVFDCEQLLPHD